ncbi:MAG: NAD-dependent epimerase/dehydratase family protein [Myxococcota bacterium]
MAKKKKSGAQGSRKEPEREGDGGGFRLALTGARTYLGERLIAAMEEDPRCEHILALDITRPQSARTKTRFVRLDLTNPASDGQMAELLREDGVDTLCHLAFLHFPSHASGWAHELEAIGSLHVMNAAAEAEVRKVVMTSTTMVYGAYPDNPSYLTEKHRLRGIPSSRWVKDKVSAERELSKLERDCPDIITTSLRYGVTLGPTIRSFWARVFARTSAVRLMGFDPLMQFLHEEDAVAALLKSIREDHEGPFNIVGDGVLYYSQVIKLGGKVPVPLPHFLAKPSTTALWQLQFVDIPGPFLDYLRYGFCADGKRMREVMGFRPRWSSRETVTAFFDAVARRREVEAEAHEAERAALGGGPQGVV